MVGERREREEEARREENTRRQAASEIIDKRSVSMISGFMESAGSLLRLDV